LYTRRRTFKGSFGWLEMQTKIMVNKLSIFFHKKTKMVTLLDWYSFGL